jgi:acetoin utilization deacetylase AcuC-like enzyme
MPILRWNFTWSSRMRGRSITPAPRSPAVRRRAIDGFTAPPTLTCSAPHTERGEHNNIVNAPLSSGSGGKEFREAIASIVMPRLDEFRPDLVVISAGFDAHMRDPLASVNLDETDFAWVTDQLMQVADRHAEGRVVSVLEGGYDLQGLSQSAAAHVKTLMRA